MTKRIRTALAALLIAFAVAFGVGSYSLALNGGVKTTASNPGAEFSPAMAGGGVKPPGG